MVSSSVLVALFVVLAGCVLADKVHNSHHGHHAQGHHAHGHHVRAHGHHRHGHGHHGHRHHAHGHHAHGHHYRGHGHHYGYGYDPCKGRDDMEYPLDAAFRSKFPYAVPACSFVKCHGGVSFLQWCAKGTMNDEWGRGFCLYQDNVGRCGKPFPEHKHH